MLTYGSIFGTAIEIKGNKNCLGQERTNRPNQIIILAAFFNH